MPPDLHNDTTWPDYPFVAVTGPHGEGTAVSISRGSPVRKVLLAPIQKVLARYRAGETMDAIDASTSGQDFPTLADLEIDWKPV
jgi:hypothetical protein